ncbi:MAG: response regulator transcription factor [Clostridiaceae bacterium]|nr:response regulator transcription factor [Clostridiaceae bacterium]
MKLIIIDDDPIVSSSLKKIIESHSNYTVVAIGTDGADAMPLFIQYLPDVILMDIQMKHQSGLEAASAVLSFQPSAKIILLTTFSDDEYIIEALRIGVKGYLLKQNFQSIIPSLEAVASGQHVYGAEIIHKLPSLSSPTKYSLPAQYESLSEKEKEVLTLVGQGLNNKEIADSLHMSEGSVRNCVSTLLDKLSLKSRTQLAIFFLKHFRK